MQASASGGKFDYFDYKVVLKKYTEKGLVKYKSLKENPQVLERFINALAAAEIPEGQNEKTAFWINAHNAVALEAAVRAYPVKSIKPTWGSFSENVKAAVHGEQVSLSQVADRARQAGKSDPRIETALVLPAVGSGELPSEIFESAKLDAQFTAAFRRALDNVSLVKVDHENKTLWLGPPIYRVRQTYIDRYNQMYHTQNATIINALGIYADARQRRRLNSAVGYQVRELPFDWKLNEREEPPCALNDWTPQNPN